MDARYKYGHRPGRRRRTRIIIVLVISVVILGLIGGFIYWDLRKNQSNPVETTGRTVVQALDDTTNNVTLDDTYFSMELPADWKEVSQSKKNGNYILTWRATQRNIANRYLKVYVDNIPQNYAVNRMLPVEAMGSGLGVKEVSSNCSTFTQGGASQSAKTKSVESDAARYEGVDFLCNLAGITDNEVGTSSKDGVNTVAVTGSKHGKHTYFFVFTDHNVQPDYNILYNALRSFKAK